MTGSRLLLSAAPGSELGALLERVRAAAHASMDSARTADRVAAALLTRLPRLDVLDRKHRQGGSHRLRSQVVHAEPTFSVVALVVQPGQQTSIHDHLAWCVVTVLCGSEHETVYRDHGNYLTPIRRSINPTGSVTAFAPPGDIHRVRNDGATTAISLHLYGADLRRVGSSVRHVYELPVLDAVPRSTGSALRRTRAGNQTAP